MECGNIDGLNELMNYKQNCIRTLDILIKNLMFDGTSVFNDTSVIANISKYISFDHQKQDTPEYILSLNKNGEVKKLKLSRGVQQDQTLLTPELLEYGLLKNVIKSLINLKKSLEDE